MTEGRKTRLEKIRFHNLANVGSQFAAAFDIDLFRGLTDDDRKFAALMFHRRHVYEHCGGEADEKYIADSGDTNVRPKQALRESQDTAHRITTLVAKMAKNLHTGFHEIFPADQASIELAMPRRQKRMADAKLTPA
jgi:hypothetical protein